jgi:hypothetical protein
MMMSNRERLNLDLDADRKIMKRRGEKIAESASVQSKQEIPRVESLVEHVLRPGEPYKIPHDSIIPNAIADAKLRSFLHSQGKPWFSEFTTQHRILATINVGQSKELWVLDMRDEDRFQRDGAAYVLYDPAHDVNDIGFKGIRPGDSLDFGRSSNYGRFSFPLRVSRNHFRISCDENMGLAVTDLNSTNGTIITIGAPAEESESTFFWNYTLKPDNFHRNGLFEENGKTYIVILGNKYECLDRDSESFNGKVDLYASPRTIRVDGESVEISSIYNRLKRQTDWMRFLGRADTESVLKEVEKAVGLALSYSRDGEKRVFDLESDFDGPTGRSLTDLSAFVRYRTGVCREQALLSACLLEKLKDDGVLNGIIHVERNIRPDDKGGGGHEWATFQPESSDDVYVIDVAQHFTGKKEDSPNWNYQRPSR